MKCIVHIGTEKTGTTILQKWLYSNQSDLSAEGIYLSDIIGKPNNRFLPAFFMRQLDGWVKHAGIQNLEEKAAHFKDFLSKFSEEIEEAAKTHETFVITSEHFHSRLTSEVEIGDLYNFLTQNFEEVEIVCYFRSQFDLAVSLYSTALKVHSVASLESFVDLASPERYYYNYAQIADLWSGVFGRDRCNFRIYDRDQFVEGDIRKDLISVVAPSLSFDALDYGVSSANEALSVLQAAAFRAVNGLIPYWLEGGGANPANLQAKEMLLKVEALKRGKISSRREAEVLQRFKSTNDYFFREFFASENQFELKSGTKDIEAGIPFDEVERIVESTTRTALASTAEVLGPADVDALRDIAVKIENQSELTLLDAQVLMKIAQASRPNGAFINRKVRAWGELLSSDDR